MAKFVELNEAAKILGVTPEDLVEMRSNGDIHGYRDGTSWKFKSDEVDRVLSERGAGAGSDSDLPLSDDADDESILVSEEALGHSGQTTSSTIIGKSGEAEPADSDLTLSADDESDMSLGSASDLSMGSDPAIDGVDSDVSLVPGADSDVSLIPDPGSDKELKIPANSDLASDLSLESGTGDIEITSGSDTGVSSGDLDLSLDSELALSDDDDMVLSGSGSGSDLSLSTADSGINLASPSDSGLSLEADSGISLQSPTDSGLSLEEDGIDMGGSSISSLELPEDDEVSLDDVAEPGGVQPDEQFMLSPSDEMFADESDSGSQVIALEDSEAFDQEALGGQALLAESSGLEAQLDSLGGGTGAAPVMVPAGYGGMELPEAPYSVWNVIGLVLVVFFLTLTGVLMTDTVRNMWAWEEGRDVSTGISEGITSAVFPK